ncbi:MAG TPA: hypothetical protein VM123_19755 [archaeon]|nr:hypothetical protein [archaeon]
MSKKAIEDVREREKIIKEAKSTEERNMKMKENKLFRLSLIFSGDEADLVNSVPSNETAQAAVRLCKDYKNKRVS